MDLGKVLKFQNFIASVPGVGGSSSLVLNLNEDTFNKHLLTNKLTMSTQAGVNASVNGLETTRTNYKMVQNVVMQLQGDFDPLFRGTLTP